MVSASASGVYENGAANITAGTGMPYRFPDSTLLVTGGPNYQGLWWVPNGVESGWGLNFAHHGDQVYATWYTYDTSGKAWWLSMLAGRTTPTSNTYTGKIYIDVGPSFNNYTGTALAIAVGDGTLTFSDADNGSFSYDINGVAQTKPIQRFDLLTGPQPVCVYGAATPNLALATNYQDLWWVPNGAESGWGLNLAHQGDSIYATWYTYGVDDQPLWLSALVQFQGGNVYTGQIYQNSGPRFDVYDKTKVVANPVGNGDASFADGNHATFGYLRDGRAVSRTDHPVQADHALPFQRRRRDHLPVARPTTGRRAALRGACMALDDGGRKRRIKVAVIRPRAQ